MVEDIDPKTRLVGLCILVFFLGCLVIWGGHAWAQGKLAPLQQRLAELEDRWAEAQSVFEAQTAAQAQAVRVADQEKRLAARCHQTQQFPLLLQWLSDTLPKTIVLELLVQGQEQWSLMGQAFNAGLLTQWVQRLQAEGLFQEVHIQTVETRGSTERGRVSFQLALVPRRVA